MTFHDCLPIGTFLPVPDPKPQVMFACPVYSAPMVEFVCSLQQVLPICMSRVAWHGGDSLITRARNNIAHDFLQTEIPYLLSLDSDLTFDQEAIKRLLSWGPEYGIIGGCYPKKKVGPVEWVFNPLPGEEIRPDGLVKVAENGTGMLRIHRWVFAAIREAYPQLRYRCDGNKDIRFDFYPVGTFRGRDALAGEEARYLSEDWYICQLARQIGIPVWADTKVTAGHIGRVTFPWPPGDQVMEGSDKVALPKAGEVVRKVEWFGGAVVVDPSSDQAPQPVKNRLEVMAP